MDLVKKLTAIFVLIGIVFSGYFFIDRTYARASSIDTLAMRADNTDLALKLLMLEAMLDRKRAQLAEARKSGSEGLIVSLRDDIRSIESRILILENKLLEDG